MHIDKAVVAHKLVKPGPLFRQESGVVEVALPVLQVNLTMRNVEVAAHQQMTPVGGELVHPLAHDVQEPVLLLLLRRPRLALVHVDRGHRQQPRLPRDGEIRLDPPAAARELLRPERVSEPGPHSERRHP